MSDTTDPTPLYFQEVTITYRVLLPADLEADKASDLAWPEVANLAIDTVKADIKAHGFANAAEVHASRGPGGRGLYTNLDGINDLLREPHVTASRLELKGGK